MSVQGSPLPVVADSVTTSPPIDHPLRPSTRSRWLPGILLLALWPLLFVEATINHSTSLSRWLPLDDVWHLQLTSWLTFLALFITPGYLLAECLTSRLALDGLERLAIAFPLGVVIMALPGMMALLLHLTISELAIGWMVTALLVALLWGWYTWRHPPSPPRLSEETTIAWRWDEWALLLLIIAAFFYVLPTLNLYTIDGDAYAVGTFSADALDGLPLNDHEPLFGTEIGPGVRMAFNQSLPLAYLWSFFSTIDPITLAAAASRAPIALCILLAIYTLGKAAGQVWLGSMQARRFALFVVAIQSLIYYAAPFLRGDHVSIFFFERTTADKFMVPTTMLPVVFALVLRYVASGDYQARLTAAAVSLAVSTIHPLIAAMMAMALLAFAGFHWLLYWRDPVVLRRCIKVGGLAAIAMALPILQLILARGDAPLAPSFPTSLDGWPVGYKQTPALPFVHLSTLDIVGPLPNLSQLQASDANTTTNPFLIWRFDVNMNRRRLIFFDLNHYISDPNLLIEPPYLLALLLLPLLLRRLRHTLAAQFALSTTLAILFVMFNPWLTPLMGKVIMPWILWRFVWLLPYALIIALAIFPADKQTRRQGDKETRRESPPLPLSLSPCLPLAFTLVAAILLFPMVRQNLQSVRERAASPYIFPAPTQIFADLRSLTARGNSTTVLADQEVSVTLPAYVARANVVAHRMPTTSEIFPADRQDEALQRLIDQANFFRSKYLTSDALAILRRYQVGYVIANSGTELDLQLRAASQWFTWLRDEDAYTLYRVVHLPERASVIEGNDALSQHLWSDATRAYTQARTEHPNDLLALLGLAEIARSQGKFNEALQLLKESLADRTLEGEEEEGAHLILHDRLGQLYTELGQAKESMAEFAQAQAAAPHNQRIALAWGDACLSAGELSCAEEQFQRVVNQRSGLDEPSRQIALADLWRQRGYPQQALPLYQSVAASQPSLDHQLMLASRYLEMNQLNEAETILERLRRDHPLTSEVLTLDAQVQSQAGKHDESIARYRLAIQLLDWQGQESTQLRLDLARQLMTGNDLVAAQAELDPVLQQQPNNAQAHRLQGDLRLQQNDVAAATAAYQQAWRLDPTQVSAYLSLSNQLHQAGSAPQEMASLLQRAMQANPDEATLALALGNQLEEQGNVQAAIDAYRLALDQFERIDADPNLPPDQRNTQANRLSRAYAYSRLANASETIGEVETAMNYYYAAAALNQTGRQADKETRRQGDKETAGSPCLLVSLSPCLPSWPQVLLGDALRRRGQLSEAEAAYQQALANDPQAVDALLGLHDLVKARGDTTLAHEYQQRALEVALTVRSQESGVRSQEFTTNNQQSTINSQQSEPLASLVSDERSGNDSASVLPNPDRMVQEMVRSGQLRAENNAGNQAIHLLAQIYRENNATDSLRQLYQQLLQEGTRQGWSSTQLAVYQSALGDLDLAENRAEQAVQAYQAAMRLNPNGTQPAMGYARALVDRGQTDAAIQQLRTLIQQTPGLIDAQLALAELMAQEGDHEGAMALYKQAAQAQPGNARATLAFANAYRTAGAWDAAEKGYRATLVANAGNVEAHLALISLLVQAGRDEEAQTLLNQALPLDSNNSEAAIQAGILAQRRGDETQAQAWFAKATADSTRPVSILVDQMVHLGQFDIAISLLQKELQKELQNQPAEPAMLLQLARLLGHQARFDEATALLLRAEQQQGVNGQLNAAQAELYDLRGMPREALALYRSCLYLSPSASDCYLRASELWLTQGNLDEALATLRSGLMQVSDPTPLYDALARIELQQQQLDSARLLLLGGIERVGERDQLVATMGSVLAAKDPIQAMQWYSDSLKKQPERGTLLLALGQLYLQTKQEDEAVKTLQQAIQQEPNNARAYLLLGNAYVEADKETRRQGEREGRSDTPCLLVSPPIGDPPCLSSALAAYQQAQRLDPMLTDAYLGMVTIDEQEEKWTEAEKRYLQAMQVAPTDGRLQVAYATLLQKEGKSDQARSFLSQAVQKFPTRATLVAAGALYQTLGLEAEAEQALKTALDKEPGALDALIALNKFYAARGRSEEAQALYERAIVLAPGLKSEQ